MKDREFNIEDAYQIFVLFMQVFWWDHFKHIMIKKGLVIEGLTSDKFENASSEDQIKSELFGACNFVFNIVPGDPCGCSDYLIPLIKERLNISEKEINQNLKIKERYLFEIVIDFCSYFNNKFGILPNDYPKNALDFPISFLNDMFKHPENFKEEWAIWNEVVDDIIIRRYISSSSFDFN